jgi:internalin A
VLDHARLAEIWPAEQRWLRPHLLRLMERFDLSFRLEDDRRSLVAQLVPAAPPPLPWTAASPCPPGARQRHREFQLAEPVPGLMAALTVRLHGSGVGLHWRHGVFLRHPNARYDSSALLSLHDGDRLRLEVRAPAPDLFFHMLLGAVEAYFERRWPGLRVEQFLPCPSCAGRFPLERLQAAHGTVQCSTCFRRHDVADLLHGGGPDPGDLGRRLADLQSGLDRLDERLETMQTESAHALRLLLAFVTTEITDCPRLFTLTRHAPTGLAKVKVHQEHYRLTLWCEEPDRCHPWPASSVTFDQTRQWVARMARYTRPVYTLLRSTVPLAGAVVGLLIQDQQTLATANKELDLVKALLVDLPPDVQHGPPVPAGGAHLREVRDFLAERCGPYFGGLSRVAAPTGEYLWICPEHRTRYEPGLPLVD